jgi:hypothetical protein
MRLRPSAGLAFKALRSPCVVSNDQRRAQADAGLKTMRASAARQRGIAPEEVDMTNIRGLFFVHTSYLGAAHDEIITGYGSIEGFIRDGIGWSDSELQRLRDGLLE